MPSARAFRTALTGSEAAVVKRFVETLTAEEAEALLFDFGVFARDDQLPPAGTWRVWLVMGGRGAGKTRTGAEWVRGKALGRTPYGTAKAGRIALIGETLIEAREVMVEGPSGLIAIHPRSERPRFEATRRRVLWPNGAEARLFSADDPDSLRGAQFDAAWGDEAGKWRLGEATFDMALMGLRLGDHPQMVLTTTPRPVPLIRRLVKDEAVTVTRAPSRANAAFLAEGIVDALEARYGGTALGRQELDGELIEDRADTLFPRMLLERARVSGVPDLQRIVIAVDPPATSGAGADACGIVAAGLDAAATVFVLEDASLERAAPERWALAAAALFRRLEADCLVAEVNQGGEMVRTVLETADPALPVKMVRATRGKRLRAEPVSLLYARGRVKHAGHFPALEDEMVAFAPDGSANGRSPDRLDALVWAVTALLLDDASPRARAL
ncbi:MAG: DNA-packaging protein [Hyphomicrobiaceae bacterium]|nr:DNA-packaging protein [Hyphomicrobiaceae bacterium]